MTGQPGIHTFLIADNRGYSRYTDEFGAEAAARLTAQFVEMRHRGRGDTWRQGRGDPR